MALNLEHIVINLFKQIKPEIEFKLFLEQLSEQSNKTVSWKIKNINDINVYMFFHEWNVNNVLPVNNTSEQNYITKYFNNLIMDESFNIIMYNGPKIYDSIRDDIDLEKITEFISIDNLNKCKIYEANEGTTINIFYYNDSWYFTTKRTFDMSESIYGSNNSHGLMFESIIERNDLVKDLDKSLTYHFTLVHKLNSHLSTINDNNLYLIDIRNTTENFASVPDSEINSKINHLLSDKICLQKTTTIDSLKEQTLDKQGIIIYFNEYIFRIYNEIYGNTLLTKPYYGTIQEKYFHQYQKNELLINSEIKLYTLTSFNYVAIILHRILHYFTSFTTDEPKLKFKQMNADNYHHIQKHNVIIRNLNKLQRIPFIIKTLKTVDFNQVKFHLKNHCNYRDIYMMFKIFKKENEILKCINYNPRLSIQQQNDINTNLEAFANLKF